MDYNNYGGTLVCQGSYNDVRIGGLKGGQDLQLNDQNGYGLYLKIVGGFNTTYSGVLSETYPTFYNAALIQNGTGSLTLSGQSTFYGNYAYQGSVELWSGALVAGASSTGRPAASPAVHSVRGPSISAAARSPATETGPSPTH